MDNQLKIGCGLISNEDFRTFTWLFKTLLSCMSGRAPNAIITNQDQAMKNAIEIVFFKCTSQVGSSNNDSVNIRNPPSVHRKGRPRSKRLKSTYEKIVTSIQKKNKNLQESDHNELGFGAMNSETTKKLSKKNKEENINDYYVQRDVNHNGYTNFTASIWWIYSELCSTTTTISFAKWFNFSPSIVQLQHLAVPMHQSSNINSLNAVFNPSNLTFGYPTTRFNPP
ncbi:uncharacterized protein [Rutidosis leptorrhynchoides]|uniref:uncharacterized protein isoform X3 n=1 Tax=Rutidosis leptorrhynchoides TaxID=125765 RepID=UPI003A991BFA